MTWKSWTQLLKVCYSSFVEVVGGPFLPNVIFLPGGFFWGGARVDKSEFLKAQIGCLDIIKMKKKRCTGIGRRQKSHQVQKIGIWKK